MSHNTPDDAARTTDATSTPLSGVRFVSTGSALPKTILTNHDLEKLMDTSHEWIVQRTGIHQRYIHKEDLSESTSTLAISALDQALTRASLKPTDLDMILVSTMTPDMPTPSVGCIVAEKIGAHHIPAFDLNAACSGFVYALNVAHALVAQGMYRRVAVIGSDCVTRHAEYTTHGRNAAILFGDAASACILEKTDNTAVGLLAQSMHTDGEGSKNLYIPAKESHYHPETDTGHAKLNTVQMNGSAVFKFAVKTFPDLIAQTLDIAGIGADQVDHYICHQSNARILTAARDRFGLPEEKLFINIDRFGNTVSASVPLVFDERRQAGAIKPGQKVMFLAFGAGLTWASSLWQL